MTNYISEKIIRGKFARRLAPGIGAVFGALCVIPPVVFADRYADTGIVVGEITPHITPHTVEVDSLFNEAKMKIGNNVTVLTSFVPVSSDVEQRYSSTHDEYLANLDHLMFSYHSQGIKIDRIVSMWERGSGTFTIGSDWSNFTRGLPLIDDTIRFAPLPNTPQVVKQIVWSGRSGFSIALEDSYAQGKNTETDRLESLQTLTDGPPNLVLSWQGESLDQNGGQNGGYKISVLGSKLNLDESTVSNDRKLGWGLNLVSGWKFGDLLAALNVTFGNGINRFILSRFGNDIVDPFTEQVNSTKSFNILPSVSYSIKENSDFHMRLGRYQSLNNEVIDDQIETLDTINLGYTWSPFPGAKFGIEVTSTDFKGVSGEEDSATIKFGAEKRF